MTTDHRPPRRVTTVLGWIATAAMTIAGIIGVYESISGAGG